MMGSRQSGAVRSLLDDLEGTISNAHQAATATGRDIALVSWGAWDKDNKENQLCIAFGDADLAQTADDESSATIVDIGKKLLKGEIPTDETEQTVAVPFHYSPSDAVQKRACIVTNSDGDNLSWAVAMGEKKSIDDEGVGIKDLPWEKIKISEPDNNFCQYSGNAVSVYISGRTKRFSKSAFIKIVGTNSNGRAIANGPVGLIVLLENSATVFKFYNPGGENGGGEWRRL
jgi:hypothetical protein